MGLNNHPLDSTDGSTSISCHAALCTVDGSEGRNLCHLGSGAIFLATPIDTAFFLR